MNASYCVTIPRSKVGKNGLGGDFARGFPLVLSFLEKTPSDRHGGDAHLK
jgi:hypothetical protein